MPRRLLERRLENFKQHDEVDSADKASCCYQWLVKWCGLGYEHATWESEDEPFFNSSEAENLIKEFEARNDRAKRRLSLEMHKVHLTDYSRKYSSTTLQGSVFLIIEVHYLLTVGSFSTLCSFDRERRLQGVNYQNFQMEFQLDQIATV